MSITPEELSRRYIAMVDLLARQDEEIHRHRQTISELTRQRDQYRLDLSDTRQALHDAQARIANIAPSTFDERRTTKERSIYRDKAMKYMHTCEYYERTLLAIATALRGHEAARVDHHLEHDVKAMVRRYKIMYKALKEIRDTAETYAETVGLAERAIKE